MKTLSSLFCLVALLVSSNSIYADGLYKWTDAKGNTQYGDKPPANSNAKPLDLPKITIIDNYADQWKPLEFKEPTDNKPAQRKQQSQSGNTYTKLAFLAPKADQAIRANDGDVTAIITIKPPLKKDHNIIFSIDGKPTKTTKSRTENFSNLDRGSHTIGVKIVDAKGKTVKSSSVGFNVLRTSIASVNRANNNQNTASQSNSVRSFNSVRQQQLQNSN